MSIGEEQPVVAYVVPKFPTLSETSVLSEMLALEARGLPLHVFSLARPNDPRFHEDLPKLKARVTYVPGPSELRTLLRHNHRAWRRYGKSYAHALGYALASGRPTLLWRVMQAAYIANVAERLGIRHVHARFADRAATIAFFLGRITGLPYSFTAQAGDIYRRSVRHAALARKAREARFVATGSDVGREYLEEVTAAPEKIVRVYNGIDLTRFQPNGNRTAKPFTLLCVARLIEKKGLPVLIEACRELRRRGVPFRCEIVGSGVLRPRLEQEIRWSGLGDHVRLLGPLTQDEVRDRYHTASLFVLPSVVAADGNREGLPAAIVEALACGLPVVSTAVSGIPEVVRHGHNGLLVPPSDARALADAIQSLVADPKLRRRLRGNARASVVELFDIRRTSEELRSLLEPGASPAPMPPASAATPSDEDDENLDA
jgi:glycosyltransferase involved in cell wall biosynthesis